MRALATAAVPQLAGRGRDRGAARALCALRRGPSGVRVRRTHPRPAARALPPSAGRRPRALPPGVPQAHSLSYK